MYQLLLLAEWERNENSMIEKGHKESQSAEWVIKVL